MKGLVEQHSFDFNGIEDIEVDNDFIYSYTETIISQIVKEQDDYLREQIINYAKEYAQKKEENVKLWLLDEDIVKLIIDLGIQEYIRRYNNGN